MTFRLYSNRQIICGLLLTFVGILLLTTPQVSASKDSPLDRSNSPVRPADLTSNTIFLPMIIRSGISTSRPATIFGVQMENIAEAGGLTRLADAGTYWTRGANVWWANVEPTRGVRNWAALSGQESELKNAASLNMPVVVVVHGTPAWAQLRPPSECGPIKRENFVDFANFMQDLVARFSVPPYNVKHWELWNEEDIDPLLVPANSQFGCWGNSLDSYYGGGYYADMLKVIYPQIKAADPQAQVLVGGLLLDCDPRLNAACLSGKFFEGILQNGGGNFFDGVSYHGYDYSVPGPTFLGAYFDNGKWNSAYNSTGPVSIAKARFIRSVLSQYNLTGKFLMNTESALLCDACVSDQTFETTKAYYLAQAYGAGIAEGLKANIWFTAMGWRNSGMINADLSERPAFTAYQFAAGELRDSTFLGDIADSDMNGGRGVKGYKYNRGDRRIWLLWSLDGANHVVSLPGVPLAAWDAFGNPVPTGAFMTVGVKPLYLEWDP